MAAKVPIMAVQAARLVHEVGYIGCGREMIVGHEFVNLMKQEGVHTEGILITDEKPTGVGFIVKDVKANNVIVVAMRSKRTDF